MRSFYSILQVPVRPAGQERLNIGLLLVGDQGSYFRFSKRKLELVRKLIPSSSFDILRSYLHGLTKQLLESNNSLKARFERPDFVNYLADYNNNLITFSKPTLIEIEVNDKSYQALFEKFVFTYEEPELRSLAPKVISIQKRLKMELYPLIKDRVNLEQTLTAHEIPGLLVPSVKVNFIGQNNKPVAGQGVDFEATPDQITNNVSRLISLIKGFELENKKGKYYVIGKEPDKRSFKAQHDNWSHIKSSGLIEFVPMSETERVSNYILKHDVRPFVES